MEALKYTLASPEVLKFFNLTERDVAPEYQEERIKKFVDRLSTDDLFEYENELIKQGANPQAFTFLDDYIGFEPTWKNQASIESINSLANIAQDKPNPIYSYSLEEGPLYRGAKLKTSPSVGEVIESPRFRSFSPDINIAGPFVNEGAPVDFSLSQEEFKKQLAQEPKQKVLFQVQPDSPGSFKYLITPGAGEPEVLSRPNAKYVVQAKETFPFWQRGMTGDIDFIKLRQIYGVDPLGAALGAGSNLLKNNKTGAAAGAGISLLDPSVAAAVNKNDYGQVVSLAGKDLVTGAAIEQGTKEGLKLAGKYAPAVVPYAQNAAKAIGRVSPVLTGAAIFAQGRPGSLTDVVTRKAASNPVPWLPSVKPNPKTDLGARAGRAISNEARYVFQQLLKGKLPYSR